MSRNRNVDVHVTNVFNHAKLQFIMRSPAGPIAKDLLKRAARVESRAKRNLSGITGSGPRRIDTGLLRNSITSQLFVIPEGFLARIGTNVFYARYVHDGTGLYGPKHALIYPQTAKVLVFRSKIYGAKRGRFRGKVVARYVRGMRPNPFLKDALPTFRT